MNNAKPFGYHISQAYPRSKAPARFSTLENMLKRREWRGATVGEPEMHEFGRSDRAMAIAVRHPSGAVAWLRVEALTEGA